MLPQAEINTAGVIIAVRTVVAKVKDSTTLLGCRSFIEINPSKGNHQRIPCVFFAAMRRTSLPVVFKNLIFELEVIRETPGSNRLPQGKVSLSQPQHG